MGHTQFQDITRQSVESVLTGLAALGERVALVAGHLRERGDDAALRRLDDSLSSLHETYVMARQRSIHAAATGAAEVRDTAPAIELF
jgi:methyl-accepting chemotaxis protein